MSNINIPSGYKPSPFGPIPEDWEVKRLGEIVSVNSGKDYKHLSPGNIPVYGTGGYMLSVSDRLSDIDAVGIGRKGTIDKPQYLRAPFWTVDTLFYLTTKGCNDLEFVFNISQIVKWKKYSEQTGVPSLTSKSINNILILVPPLPEQQRIVSVLSLWDTAIAKQTALIEKLTLRKRGLMQQLLTGKKRLKGFDEEWMEVRLGDIGDTYSGLINKNKDDFEEGNARYIPYMNVFSNEKVDTNNLGQVKVSASEKQTKVKYGDIFFTVSSETPEEVGMASVLLYDIENTYLNSFCFGYRPNGFETLLPVFASHLLRGNSFRKEMYKIAQGSTRFNISKNEVMDMRIALPSINEQNAIASVLVNADKEIEIQKQKLAALQEQKKGLMQVLLTGKKRIK